MYCDKCGKEIENEWKFCNYCGNKLDGDNVINEKENNKFKTSLTILKVLKIIAIIYLGYMSIICIGLIIMAIEEGEDVISLLAVGIIILLTGALPYLVISRIQKRLYKKLGKDSRKNINNASNSNNKKDIHANLNIFTDIEKLKEKEEELARNEIIELVEIYKLFDTFSKYVKIDTNNNSDYYFKPIDDLENFKEEFFKSMYIYVSTRYDNSIKTQIFFDNLVDISDCKKEDNFEQLYNLVILNIGKYNEKNIKIFNTYIKEIVRSYNEYALPTIKLDLNFNNNSSAKEENEKKAGNAKLIHIGVPIIIMIFSAIYAWNIFEEATNISLVFWGITFIAFMFMLAGIGGANRTCPNCKKYNSMKDIDSEVIDRNISYETETYYDSQLGQNRTRNVTYEILDLKVLMKCGECGYQQYERRRKKNKI